MTPYRPTRPLSAAALLSLLLLAPSSRAAEPFTPEDLARLREVTAAVISPDARHIAYTLRVPRTPEVDENGPAWSELHVTDAGNHNRPFITGRVNIDHLAWSPDGTSIGFTAKLGDDAHTGLYAIPVDGGQARRLCEHDADIRGFAWSGDGTQVAFLAPEPEPKEREERRKSGYNQEVVEEDAPRVRIYIVRVAAVPDGDAADVAPPSTQPAAARALDLPGSASAVVWSADSTRLAAAVAPVPGEDAAMMFTRLHILDAASGRITGEVQRVGKLGEFRFSPDGRHIALIAAADIHDPSEGRLKVAAASGGSCDELLPNLPGHVRGFAWHNNETIMYLTHEGCGSVFGKCTIDGRANKPYFRDTPVFLQGLSLASDGRTAVFVGDAPGHPGEVCILRQNDPAPIRVTNSNPWLAERSFAKQEVITYAARDKVEIQGPLIYPLNHDPARKYPLVLVVHGGPEAHFSQQWLTSSSRLGQVLAARGYFVFYPNYRGSTGRGVAFSKMDHRDLAGREFLDLVDGVEHLDSLGLIDRARVGVTGGSYGGYATAWCATKLSEHFAAGVMSVGLTDLTSFFGTTDIPHEMNLVHARVWPWEDAAFFADRSPLTHARSGRTPLLILHGKADERVHPSQSLALYRYLRLLAQAPVRLVLYPGEGHGNQKAAARYDYSLRALQWFDHYLKEPDRRTAAPPAWEPEYKLHWKAPQGD